MLGRYIKYKKKLNNDGNQIITLAVQANVSFDFGLVFQILRRLKPRCVVFGPSTTANSCQDADLFPGMMYIYNALGVFFKKILFQLTKTG